MKNLSNSNVEEFLKICKPERVEGRTLVYNGREYAIPYSTIKVQDILLPGLRENEKRLELFENIILENTSTRSTYLDIGCNLGVFVKSFNHLFEAVLGIDYDEYYIGQCRFLYPEMRDAFKVVDLNKNRIPEVIDRQVDVITALSMVEYIEDKKQFISDIYESVRELCIIEGHSEDIVKGYDIEYEKIIMSFPWKVTRLEETTDVGVNAPVNTRPFGRPVWVCIK
jgi:hypothetical protein